MKAVIFTSPADFTYAESCSGYLSSEFGIDSVIIDDLPKDKKMHGLIGSDTMKLMLDIMIAASDDDDEVIVRVDTDTVLLERSVNWLGGATRKEARGYLLRPGRETCNPFSATRGHLKNARPLLRTANGNGCSTCLICHALKKGRQYYGEGEMARELGVYLSKSEGEDPPEDAHCIVLPNTSFRSVRVKQMDKLWGFIRPSSPLSISS